MGVATLRNHMENNQVSRTNNWEVLADESKYCPRELARLCHVSLRTLQRRFATHYGMTISDWMRQIRLAKAYARVVAGSYKSADELPADNWHPSRHVIFLTDVPDRWPDGARVQLFVHAWDDARASWEPEPLAFTQNSLTPRRTLAGVLFLYAAADTGRRKIVDLSNPEAARLAPGRYLLKACLDHNGRLSRDPTVLLGDEDYVGQTEIQAKWGEGYPAAEKLAGKLLK